MSEYDSILKEKKKKVEVKEEIKKFPKFWVSILLIIIVLVLSYVIYFDKVLNARAIVLNDTFNVLKKYSSLIHNIPVDEFKSEKNIVGVILYGQDKYDFNIVKNDSNIGFNISNNDKYINYYLLDNKAYVKVPSIDEYVSLNYTFSISTLLNLKDILNNISEDKFIKNVYFEDERPIVEVNLSLNSKELNEIFGLGLKDEYEVIATFKNGAIMNETKEIKLVINNKTKSDRRVITIKGDNVTYTVGGDIYNIVLETSGSDFSVKISKNDLLYSIFRGADNENGYLYTYQIIDTVYNINVLVSNDEEGYLFELKNKKGEVEENMSVTLKINDSYLIEHDALNFIDSSNQLISSKYNSDINYFKDRLLKFVNKG